MDAPKNFTLTHLIRYAQDSHVVHEWKVQLLDRHTGAAVTDKGDTCWSLSPQGLWEYYGPLDVRRFPHGEVRVTKIDTAPQKIKKGQEPKFMPNGTLLAMRRSGDKWLGTCSSDGKSIEAESAGLMGLGSKLCRKWLKEHGHMIVKGKVD